MVAAVSRSWKTTAHLGKQYFLFSSSLIICQHKIMYKMLSMSSVLLHNHQISMVSLVENLFGWIMVHAMLSSRRQIMLSYTDLISFIMISLSIYYWNSIIKNNCFLMKAFISAKNIALLLLSLAQLRIFASFFKNIESKEVKNINNILNFLSQST